ncbi:MAG: hypothetical protein ACXW0J_00680 [Nitrososphaeraceae archaeon]
MKTSQRKKLMSEFEKRFIQKKSHHKGRKILSKSMQGHSPKYE